MIQQMKIGDIFTDKELDRAVEIVKTYNMPHRKLLAMVEPLMPRINKATGQENDARYFSYLLEGVVRQYIKGGK